MKGKLQYWNGYRWVDDPPMAGVNPPTAADFDLSDVKETLLDVELNPRKKTQEEIQMIVLDEEPPLPEQPTPNFGTYEEGIDAAIARGEKVDFSVTRLGAPTEIAPEKTDMIERSIDVFTKSPARNPDLEDTQPAIPRTVTRDQQEATGRGDDGSSD